LFEPQDLDADKDNDEFFADAKSGPRTVKGEGQWVYWRNCSVIKVFPAGKEDGKYEKLERSKGKAFLKRGTDGVSLIIEGGEIKEE
jgi:hypothetical protein